ncbi:SKP1-like protein 1B [Tanacetum coccineum]
MSRTITLESSDGVTFDVEEAVAKQSGLITRMMEEDPSLTIIRLPNINAHIFSLVIELARELDNNDDIVLNPDFNLDGIIGRNFFKVFTLKEKSAPVQTAFPITFILTWIIYPVRSAIRHFTRCIAQPRFSEKQTDERLAAE